MNNEYTQTGYKNVTANNVGNMIPQAKQLEVAKVSEKLHAISDELTISINHLENRLDIVMRKELESEISMPSVPEFITPLAQDMNTIARKIETQVGRINTIIRKLEI